MGNDLSSIGHSETKKKSETARVGRFFKSEKSVKLFSALLGSFVLVLVVLSALQIPHLNTEYSLEQFFPARHPLLAQSAKIRRTFQLNEHPSFLMVLELTNDNWLTPVNMHKLTRLTHKIQEQSATASALSLGTLEGALNEQSSLNIGPLYERLPARQWRSFTENNSLIRSQLISPDAKSVLVVVEPKKLSTGGLNKFSARLEHLVHQQIPSARLEIGGVPAIQGQLSARLFSELRFFLLLSLLAFCSVFCLFFRGFSAVALTLTSLILANLAVIGTLAYFKIPFSVLLTTLPIVVSIALVSVNIHSLHRWAELVRDDLSRSERFLLSLKVLKEMSLANFLGSLTTAIGFITLCTTPIPLIRQYGWVVALAVMGAWLLTHFVLLGFMHFTTPVLRDWTQRKATWALPLLREAFPVVAMTLVVCAAMGFLGKNLSFSARLFDDLPRHDSARAATEKIDQHFGGVANYELVLRSRSENFWREPSHLIPLKKALAEMRELPALGSAVSLPDFFDHGRVPATRQAVSEFLFLYSMSEANPLKNYVTEDGRSLRVAVRFHDQSSSHLSAARAQIKKIIGQKFPGVSISEAGLAVSSHTINQEVAKDLVFNFWHSIVLVGFLLMFVFRSVRWALVACLPNLVPPAVLIGVLAATHTPVKPGVALIFSIALGLAFNNTVYLLSRMKRMMREKNLSFLPLKQAILQEGNPCLFETLVMFAGFVIFLGSDFKLNQTFGVYMLLSIVAGAVADLAFLPAVLKLFPVLLRPLKKSSPAPVLANEEAESESDSLTASGKVAASLALVLLLSLSLAPKAAAAPNEAAAILKKVQKNLEAKDDEAVVKMKIIEANGEIKTRTMKLQTLRDKKFHALVRIQAPADIKGTGFLAEIDGDKQEQWIYLPSSKQVRRVVGNKKSTGVLGSELTVEDLDAAAIKSSSAKLVKKDAQTYVIEVVPKPGTSVYNKVLMSFSTKELVPLQTQYFQNNKLKKTVRFSHYTKIGSLYRARLIQVRNLGNKRGTDLELSGLKVNAGLTADDFSETALKPD
jgi:predicted RND superfamily exporter protein/outer membrane lipoprotein-sorting protein